MPPAIPVEPSPVAPVAPPVLKRHFECTEKGSSKFWEVAVTDNNQTVRFGRIGSSGQTMTKSFPTPEACGRDTERMIQEKLRKGYLEKKPPASSPGSAS